MLPSEGGGGGNPYAGPHELRLRRVLNARSGTVRTAAGAWRSGALQLDEVARTLWDQAELIKANYEGDTGTEAAARYLEVRETVLKRQKEMETAEASLLASADAIDDATTAYSNLPGVMSPPGEFTPTGNPIRDTVLRGRHAVEEAGHDISVANREAQARQAMATLDRSFGSSAEQMGEVAGEKPPVYDAPGGPSDAGTQITTGTGPSRPRTQTLGNPDDDRPDGPPRDEDDPRPDDTDPGTDPTDDTDDNVGDVSGGRAIPDPADPLPSRGGPGGGPAGGSGALGAGATLGAGALSGAGAIAASRGAGAPVRPVTAGTSGAIGKSGTPASRGTLGRTVLPPGQQGAPGRSAATGRGAGRGPARGQIVPGQQGAGAAGQAGARGPAGGRGAAGAAGSAGSTSERKAPLSAATTGGRQGRRDEDREGREGIVFDDEQSWLDDDSTGDAVID